MNQRHGEPIDLVGSQTEFTQEFAQDLGLHSFDPEDIERDVKSQIEKRMGLVPAELFANIKRDGSRLRKGVADNVELLQRSIRTAKQDMLRLRNDEVKRRDELLVKIKFLQDMLQEKTPPPPSAPVAAGPVETLSNIKAASGVKSDVPIPSTSSSSSKKKRIRDVVEEGEVSSKTEESAEAVQAPKEPPPTLTCHVCEAFSTTSLRQLNLHVNQCLKDKQRQENDGADEDSVGTVEEDDILDGDLEDEEGGSATKKKRRRINEEVNLSPIVEDDWDRSYAKKRQRRFIRAYKEWIKVWNECRERNESDEEAQKKAEEAFETTMEQIMENARLGVDDLHSSEEESVMDGEENTSAEYDSDEDDNLTIENAPKHAISEQDNYYAPQRLWNRLLPHQREAMAWLFTHHQQCHGAILGDEMGLGKTAQAIGFLACLKTSNMLNQPTLVLAPATTLSQWVQEFNNWYAPFRVVVLHDSFKKKAFSSAARTGPEVVMRAFDEKQYDVIIATYQGLQVHAPSLLRQSWGYVVLDEAHCIRNPDINMTKACKQLRTCHRLALTGAPIQNRLTELWSLFDFICPGRLGHLSTFEQCFAEPIRRGGMAGATPEQVYQAYEAAKALRKEVTPFMLRRMKKDVTTSLPPKTERVLFCNLTPIQRQAYLKFLKSSQVSEILTASRDVKTQRAMSGKTLSCISTLRKICNHPDLLQIGKYGGIDSEDEDEDGIESEIIRDISKLHLDMTKSSKMRLLDRLLQLWRKEGAKVLVFCQGTTMLTVLQNYAEKEMGWPTLRMDGSTPVKRRQQLITRFNKGGLGDTFLFLLTTRVGGIGVNLTGATKVVIFDPDWNPSTDAQARERAWRLGQTKPVTVFRMIVSGTIEEKIYRRQIFKTFLTNKILHDPAQRRFFDETHLRDLFTLDEGKNETADMFSEEPSIMAHDEGKEEVKSKSKKKNNKKRSDVDSEDEDDKADAELLKSLFSKEDDFAEALDQDRVELAARTQNERVLAERKAKIAASKAYKLFLQQTQSARRVQDRPISVPVGGQMPPSAASLLAGGSTWDLEEENPPTGEETAEQVHAKVLGDIVAYLKRVGMNMGASTRELLKFGDVLKNTTDHYEEVFRSLLRQVADFDKTKKRWTLKRKNKNNGTTTTTTTTSSNANPSRSSSTSPVSTRQV